MKASRGLWMSSVWLLLAGVVVLGAPRSSSPILLSQDPAAPASEASAATGDAAKSTPPDRLRVNSGAMQLKLTQSAPPKYPKAAKKNKVEGEVLLEVLIAKNGKVTSVKTLSGDPQLAKAATDAVKRWRYTTTLLNGNPIEVITQVHINFKLNP